MVSVGRWLRKSFELKKVDGSCVTGDKGLATTDFTETSWGAAAGLVKARGNKGVGLDASAKGLYTEEVL